MANGSFAGLYTFEQVANIYNIDPSTIRKQVQASKFTKGEIKKFGKTWIMTEQAMKIHYGSEILAAYKKQLILEEQREIKIKKEQAKYEKQLAKKQAKEFEKIQCMDGATEDTDTFTWKEIKIDDKDVLKSFKLS